MPQVIRKPRTVKDVRRERAGDIAFRPEPVQVEWPTEEEPRAAVRRFPEPRRAPAGAAPAREMPPGIYRPGEYAPPPGEDIFRGGVEVPVGPGATVTYPRPAGGVGLDMLYAMDPAGFARTFPGLVDDTGALREEAVARIESPTATRLEVEQAARVGPRPPDEYAPPSFTPQDRANFRGFLEREIAAQLGTSTGDPALFNPLDEANRIVAQQAPELFNRVFGGGVAWDDRERLDPQSQELWNKQLTNFRAQIVKRMQETHEGMKSLYKRGMDDWDAKAKRAEEAQKERAKAAAAAEPKELTPQQRSQAFERQIDVRQRRYRMLEGMVPDPEDRINYRAFETYFNELRSKHKKDLDIAPFEVAQMAEERAARAIEAYRKERAEITDPKELDKIDAAFLRRIGLSKKDRQYLLRMI